MSRDMKQNGVSQRCETSKAQIKHIKNFSIKNFGPPKTPPQKKFFMFELFPVF